MPLFRHSHSHMFSAIAGLATGVGLFVMYLRLSRELAEIRALIAELKASINEKDVESRKRKGYNRSRTTGYYALTGSSGDDDDNFEDALAGLSEVEQNGLTALGSDRNVQFASPVSYEGEGDGNDELFFQKIDDFITAGSKMDYENAFDLLKLKERKMALKSEFQWRLSKVAYFNANAAGDRGQAEKKKELMYKAKEAAQATINLDPSCPHGHKWFAITLGCVGDYEPTAEKIKNAIVIKKHIQLAIDLNPKDPTPHHMLGRWCYSVYMLSWLERKAAAAFFGSPPTSTVEEALEHFMQAENLNPGKWRENSLYIGKCHIEKKQYAEAAEWLRLAKAKPDDTDTDADVQAEVVKLLAKYDY